MAKDRLMKLEEYIKIHHKATLESLCHYFQISMSTLRRDLDQLSRQGVIQKSYGHVIYNATSIKLVPFHVRSNINHQGKNESCAAAASLIRDNDTIFVDSGSTACLLIDYLMPFKNITVITNNLDAILKTFSMTNLQTLVLPGELNRENNSFSPANGVDSLKDFNISKAFIAASGVTISDGFSHSSLAERPLKQAILSKSCKRYFILDDSKFGIKSLLYLCTLDTADAVCTNRTPPKEYAEYCHEHGIPLLVGPQGIKDNLIGIN